jgi:hypothetical protein
MKQHTRDELAKMTGRELTATYNAITGKTIKAGSYSRPKLVKMIEDAWADTPVRETADVPADEPKKDAPKKDAPELVAVADIARELGLNPKVVRARLRRLYASGRISELPAPQTGWTFLPRDREAITRIIKNDK